METTMKKDSTQMLSKVPQITIFFWIIKVLCTTVGETASDFLNVSLGLGLSGTSIVMGALLLAVLFFQIKAKKYIPGIYWLTVVLISVFGTLVTDIMTDKLGVPLEVSTIVFSLALALTFAIWYFKEKTLSIHSIFTMKRELFYWAAILFTFALGTATGDLMAESLGLGYLLTGVIIVVVIVSVVIAWKLKLDSILSFWIVYILTRPLGASLGDFLSQAQTNGGLGLGPTITSIIFLTAILLTVLFLSLTKLDLIAKPSTKTVPNKNRWSVSIQVMLVLFVLGAAAISGYFWRHYTLQKDTMNTLTNKTNVSDLSIFSKIAEDTLVLLRKNNLNAAKTRIADLESAWDKAVFHLKPLNPERWDELDKSIDLILRNLRSTKQDKAACDSSLESFINKVKAMPNMISDISNNISTNKISNMYIIVPHIKLSQSIIIAQKHLNVTVSPEEITLEMLNDNPVWKVDLPIDTNVRQVIINGYNGSVIKVDNLPEEPSLPVNRINNIQPTMDNIDKIIDISHNYHKINEFPIELSLQVIDKKLIWLIDYANEEIAIEAITMKYLSSKKL